MWDLFLGKRDRELAKNVAKCYYGLDDGDCEIEVIESLDSKMPNVSFINDIRKELQVWWPRNIGMKSKVARLSESDFVYCINELRARNGSPPFPQTGRCTRNGWNVWHQVSRTFISSRSEEREPSSFW